MIVCLTKSPHDVQHPDIRTRRSYTRTEVAGITDTKSYAQSYTLSASLTAIASMSRGVSRRRAYCNLDFFV